MKISVVVPAFNCAKYIEQTLDCLRFQTLKEIEIIIVLDACTDNTEDLISGHIKKTGAQNIRMIKFDKNTGPSAARNAAIRAATGEYLQFMDADDFISTDYYEKLYAAAKFADADVACANLINERIPKDSVTYTDRLVISHNQDKIDYTQVDKHGFSQRYIFRRQMWIDNKLKFPEDLRYCEDLATIPLAIVAANRLILVPDVTYHYKHRAGSITSYKFTREKQTELFAVRNRVDAELSAFFAKNKLNRSTSVFHVTRYKLFGWLTLFRVRHYPDKLYKTVQVFGIMICKIKYKSTSFRPTWNL